MNNDSPMPGAWICDKCGFTLQKNVLHTGDGSISANVADHCEGCPNDGSVMRPLTWREVNEDLFKRAISLMAQLDESKRMEAAMREALDWIWDGDDMGYIIHDTSHIRECGTCGAVGTDRIDHYDWCAQGHIEQALSTAAPSDYIPKSAVRPVVEALEARLAVCCTPDGSPDEKFSYCDACKRDMAALATARALGLLEEGR